MRRSTRRPNATVWRPTRVLGEQLGITRHTTEVHVSNSLGKLGMASRTLLAGWAVAHGLLQMGSSPERPCHRQAR